MNYAVVKSAMLAAKTPSDAVLILISSLCQGGYDVMHDPAETEKFFSELSRESSGIAASLPSDEPSAVPVTHDG